VFFHRGGRDQTISGRSDDGTDGTMGAAGAPIREGRSGAAKGAKETTWKKNYFLGISSKRKVALLSSGKGIWKKKVGQ